ncbi:inactive peptidyl-prolyl cis-trans isomerase FKBP6-like [Argonauta hians]
MDQLLNTFDSKLELKESINISKLRENGEAMFELKESDNTRDEELDNEGKLGADPMWLDNYHDDDDGDGGGHINMYSDIAFDEDIMTLSYEEQAANMTDITSDGGVRKLKIRPGTGSKVPDDSVVNVHYSGFFEFADEPFDSSRLRGEVFKFRLKKDMIIPGWVVAINTMQVGEVSRFLISPEYGFGAFGCPPRIPKAVTALFEIELLTYVEDTGIEYYFLMTEEEKSQIQFEQILKIANMEKSYGTEFFKAKKVRKSYNKYRMALTVLDEYVTCNSEEERQVGELRVLLLLNLSLCCLRLNHPTRALTYCNKVLNVDRNNAKALYRLGQAYQSLGQFKEAASSLKLAQKLRPTDYNISRQLQSLHNDVIQYKKEEKAMYQRMVGQTATKSAEPLFPTNLECMVKESEEKVVEVSQEFRDNVTKYLHNFLSDSCQSECPMPAAGLTVAEIAYVLEMVDSLKLNAVQTGSGENIQIEIRKERNNNNNNNRRVKEGSMVGS